MAKEGIASVMAAFPSNRRASAASLQEQARKCVEEANEVSSAVYIGLPEHDVAEEAIDCIVACVGVLRKLTPSVVHRSYRKVMDKGVRRGDWAVGDLSPITSESGYEVIMVEPGTLSRICMGDDVTIMGRTYGERRPE